MSGVVVVPVGTRKRIDGYVLVDACDAWVASRHWNLTGGYAVQSGPQSGVSAPMHRQILGLAPGDRVVHHINENKLDNRRANLKVCDSMSEASCEPHPLRDLAAARGFRRYLDGRRRRWLAQ